MHIGRLIIALGKLISVCVYVCTEADLNMTVLVMMGTVSACQPTLGRNGDGEARGSYGRL